jgi:hypothetical protein
VVSSGERIAQTRPRIDSICWQIRKLTNEHEISGFKATVGTQKSSCSCALERVGSGCVANRRHLRIFISLDEYCPPKSALRFDHESCEIKRASVAYELTRSPNSLAIPLFVVEALACLWCRDQCVPSSAQENRLPTIPELRHSRRLHETCKTASPQPPGAHTAPTPRLKYLHGCTKDSVAWKSSEGETCDGSVAPSSDHHLCGQPGAASG